MSHNILAIGNLGTSELVIILLIVVMLFGVGKLPEIGRQMGQGIKNFKREMKDAQDTLSLEDQPQDQNTVTREATKQNEQA